MYLERIRGPKDLAQLSAPQLGELAAEMRRALLAHGASQGGHMGPNLGMVEATIALLRVFPDEDDRLVFDVSHQSYCHKMLTGRADAYLDPAHYGDVTGFSAPEESIFDPFTIGHTSTSVALALGLARARDLSGADHRVVAIIGDGSLSGGEAFEGLDAAGEYDGQLLIVVNDNDRSIAENHGGIYRLLRHLRQTDGQGEPNLFRACGLDYRYVADGHCVQDLEDAFRWAAGQPRPVVVHIHTEKGHGFAPAVADPESWHSHRPFDLQTGEDLEPAETPSFGDITARHLLEAMDQDPSVVAITAGTPATMGFTPARRAQAGKQFIDVGIAEQCAITMAAGLARGGAKPVVGIQSTFLQRAYDQVSHDLCIDGNPATVLVFQGTVFSPHDVTHHGFYDVSMLDGIPNLVYLAPTTVEEYLSMVDWSLDQREHPVAIKVPGGEPVHGEPVNRGTWDRLDSYEVVRSGKPTPGRSVALLGLGSLLPLAMETARDLLTHGIDACVINPRFITGLDRGLLDQLFSWDVVVTLEDGVLAGGWGQKVAAYLGDGPVKVLCRGLARLFRPHYEVNQELRRNGLTVPQLTEDIMGALGV